MIRAVQNNNNACELPKANDNLSNRSDNDAVDVTLKQCATSTATNNASASAAAAAAAHDDEDDCVYISPDEAENGMYPSHTIIDSSNILIEFCDFVVVSFCTEPILIDSDTDVGRSTKVVRTKKRSAQIERAKVVPVRRKMICFCTSIYCRNCLNENARKQLFQMFICHPIITTHVKMCETVALLINLPQDKVRRIFSRLQNYLIAGAEDATALHLNKALKGYDGNFPRTLAPLELCQIKRKLLNCKPVWFSKTFSTCCRTFRYKIGTAKLIDMLTNVGRMKFRRISNRISKKSKLIAIEEKELRLERIAYIRRIQKHRKDGRRIIYINAMMIGDKMIVIAAGHDGPITSAFITNTNSQGFLKWLAKDIVSNLKERCVFVLGPSCTFRREACVPQQTDTKETICAWLDNEKIPYTSDMYKTELYELIREHGKFQTTEHASMINQYLIKSDHHALYIPFENRDLDPFEYIWWQCKLRMIANGTSSFNINGQLTSLPRDIWIEQFERVYFNETAYLQIERNFDRTFRRFRIDNDEFKSSDIQHVIDNVSC